MTQTLPTPAQCFGTNLVAMVTPMEADGSVSREGTVALVKHLVATGCDGIVVAGTTGESPTLTADELADLIALVRATADGRAKITVGVGTYDTTETVERARLAESAGADALLLVAPYYSKPTQPGLIAHCTDVADATMLPVMLYDIPGRTGTEFQTATLLELAHHPRIRAVKDAKGDLYEATRVMAQTSLAYYSGIDELNLAFLSVGATGVVSVIGNAVADRHAALLRSPPVTCRRPATSTRGSSPSWTRSCGPPRARSRRRWPSTRWASSPPPRCAARWSRDRRRTSPASTPCCPTSWASWPSPDPGCPWTSRSGPVTSPGRESTRS